MMTIHKYTLEIADEQVVRVRHGARVLSVGEQHDVLVFWAEVDTEKPPAPLSFSIRGTGHPLGLIGSLGASARFVGTVQTRRGLVWHVYVWGDR